MRQLAHTFETATGTGRVRYPYLLALPNAYDAEPERRWPLLLFLHGAGERGNDLRLVRIHGIPREVEGGRELPLIAVSPQCPVEQRWSVEALTALLDTVEREYRVDPEREYVTGMSMGGYATWALALAQPDRFAAVAPVCGGGNPAKVGAIRRLPVWAFHGAKDEVVPLAASEQMVDALRRAGGDVRLTVYPDAGHDSWTPTYQNPELYTWLLEHRRSLSATGG